MFLSGIFDARSYQIGKTLLHKRQVRGRSPIPTLGDAGLCVYNGNDSMMRDPGQKPSGMTLCDKKAIPQNPTKHTKNARN